MEKKESTASSHVGMCEKLFNAFNPASRPHRRLDFHREEPEATTIPSPTQPNHSLDSAVKEPSPQNALPTPVKPRPATLDQKKPSEPIAPKAEPKPKTPPPQPPPKPTSVSVQKVPDKLASTSTPPKAATPPQPAPPKAAATPQPVPLPAPPQGAAAAAAAKRPKKNINERVEDYIQRTKDRIRTISGVGRTPTS